MRREIEIPTTGRVAIFLKGDNPQSFQMETVVNLLRMDFSDKIQFITVPIDTSASHDLTRWAPASSLPCLLLYNLGQLLSHVEGGNPPEAVTAVRNLSETVTSAELPTKMPVIAKAAAVAPVVLFQDGPPRDPRTPESGAAVLALARIGCFFTPVDVQGNPELREALLKEANEPLPHLFLNGRFIAGLPAIRDMVSDLHLYWETLGGHITKSKEERLRNLVNSRRVMIFMKGTPDKPYCRFSKKLMQLLNDEGITNFGAMDIFEDNEARNSLKELYNWPTYPQIYVDGVLLGGIDILEQIVALGGPGALKREIENAMCK